MRRIFVLLAGATLGDGWRLRRRVRDLPVLAPFADEVDQSGGRYRVVSSIDVEVDPTTERAAIAYAAEHDLDALDLLPQGLAPEQLVDIVAALRVETADDDGEQNLFKAGSGAHHATIISAELADRLEDLGLLTDLDDFEYARLMADIKRCAPRSVGYAIAPDLPARLPRTVDEAGRRLGLMGEAAPAILGIESLVTLAAFVAALRGWRKGGWLFAASHVLQPVLATVKTAGAPALNWALAPLRAPRRLLELARMGPAMNASPHRTKTPAFDADAIAEYEDLLASGTDQFFEPKVAHCPVCNSTDLHEQASMPDMIQSKPGRFTLDRCQGCGVVFQNPRLSLSGLDFYYRDFYEGNGEVGADVVFGASTDSYEGRADLLQSLAPEPDRWLDVGAGHGHFCVFAKGQFPTTSFEGLDMSTSIKEAERRGWIDVAHYGLFPELAASLVDSYDVVSMHHYLEHTRELRAEIAAAAQVLKPGGALLIELPDPDSPLAKVLGPFYGPWFQPQHQVIAPVGVVSDLLREQGFTVAATQRREAHVVADVALAGFLFINRVAPPVGMPWRKGTRLDKVRWAVGQGLLWPIWFVVGALEQIIVPRISAQISNAFRLVAVLDAELPLEVAEQ